MSGSINLTQMSVNNISAELGAGVFLDLSTLASISTFDSNKANMHGGGIGGIFHSTIFLDQGSSASDNTATGSGGGLWLQESTCIVSASALDRNAASNGAAVYAFISSSILLRVFHFSSSS